MLKNNFYNAAISDLILQGLNSLLSNYSY